VVICAFSDERWPELVDAVDSVRRQTVTPAEIVVAIDHNPALLARARTEFGDLVVVANREQRGLSGARNSGVAASASDIVAFLDDDAVAEPDWLENLVAPYTDGLVLGVGGAIAPHWLEGRPAGFPAEFEWVVGCSYTGMPTERAAVRNVIGANMSLRRSVMDRVGGFRNGIGRVGRLPVGCEETELCIRASQAIPDGVFVYEPRARVSHSVPGSRATWRYFRSRCYAEGISKARVAASTGARDALSSEVSYVRRTLPRGVARGLADAFGGDASGLSRACLIVGGLASTGAGYLVGSVAGGRS
jgi:GT2 family glycosyltransferase